ncbi:MAG: hypothetical protein ACXVCH_17190, partial [Bdellovibrionota bacterium]
MGAIVAMGMLVRAAVPAERARLLEALNHLADEDHFRVRMALVASLGMSEASEAIGILSKIRTLDLDGRVRRTAQTTIDTLSTAGTTPESVTNLKTSLEKLEEDYRKLRSMVEEKSAGLRG